MNADYKHIPLFQYAGGETCLSVILPFFKAGTTQRENKAVLKKYIREAAALLELNETEPEQEEAFLHALHEISEELDYHHTAEGIGIYLSNSVRYTYQFMLPVTPAVYINTSFYVRPIVEELSKAEEYYVLHLSKSICHLYRGKLKELTEIVDVNFPSEYHESHQYYKPAIGSSYSSSLKGGEEHAVTIEHHLSAFYKSIDHILEPLLKNDTPLIIAGAEESISLFKQVNHHHGAMLYLAKSYQYAANGELAEDAYAAIENYQNDQAIESVNGIKEAIGTGLAAAGLETCWQLAVNANVRELTVDKEYSRPVFTDAKEEKIAFVSKGTHEKYIPDAINTLIIKVINENGEVQFVPSGLMHELQHVAVLKRYR
jgi:hypothetical protein